MNKEKPFSYKDQEIINEYNKKHNQEITKEHLNNIKKLREYFKKEVINEYKEKLLEYINKRLKNAEEQYNDEYYEDLKQYIKGEIDFMKVLLIRLKEGEFDNDKI